jgi:hypothetical protein
MGLDMYLKGKRYLSEYREQDKPMRDAVNRAVFGDGLRDAGAPVVDEIVAEAAYWRKANAIHAWFVDNCQDGTDDCGEYYVSREQLQELANLCDHVLENPKKASELLAPRGGFFFGTLECDEFYMEDVKFTSQRIKELLASPEWKDWDFYYHSSW